MFMLRMVRDALDEAVDVGINVGINPQKEMLAFFLENPNQSVRQAAERLNISARQAERIVAQLKKDGRLERVGSRKAGYWKVNG